VTIYLYAFALAAQTKAPGKRIEKQCLMSYNMQRQRLLQQVFCSHFPLF